jgi:hypothetical protein
VPVPEPRLNGVKIFKADPSITLNLISPPAVCVITKRPSSVTEATILFATVSSSLSTKDAALIRAASALALSSATPAPDTPLNTIGDSSVNAAEPGTVCLI